MEHKINRWPLAIFLSFIISAPAYSEGSVPKEDWLKSFKALAPDAICKGITSGTRTAALLKDSNIDFEKCKPLMTESLNRCLNQYSSEMPTNIPLSESKKLGETIGRCSGEDFYLHYLSKAS